MQLQQPKRRSRRRAASEVDWEARGSTPIKKELAKKLKRAHQDMLLGGVAAAAA